MIQKDENFQGSFSILAIFVEFWWKQINLGDYLWKN